MQLFNTLKCAYFKINLYYVYLVPLVHSIMITNRNHNHNRNRFYKKRGNRNRNRNRFFLNMVNLFYLYNCLLYIAYIY